MFRSFTLTWWQGVLLKLSMLSLGIVIGTGWPEIFSQWISLLLIVFVVLSTYISFVCWKQNNVTYY